MTAGAGAEVEVGEGGVGVIVTGDEGATDTDTDGVCTDTGTRIDCESNSTWRGIGNEESEL